MCYAPAHPNKVHWPVDELKGLKFRIPFYYEKMQNGGKVNGLPSATKLLSAYCILRICNALMPQALKKQFPVWIMDNGLSNAFMQTPTDTDK